MKVSRFFILSFFTFLNVYAVDEIYFFSDSSLQKKIYFQKIGKVRISSEKKCQEKECLSFRIATGKILMPIFKKLDPMGRNPASVVCSEFKGTPTIAYLKSRDEFSICLFDDASFIFGQDLLKMYTRRP